MPKMLTYPLGDAAAEEEFCRTHLHLYHRLCRLADNLAGYYLCGDAHMLIPLNASREGVPRFVAVTFDERAGRDYERRVERLLQKKRFVWELPKPSFPVTLETEFADGGRETFVFAFAAYSDETIEMFCRNICDRARIRFRRRFVKDAGRGTFSSENP